jgi:hypothetical protein
MFATVRRYVVGQSTVDAIADRVTDVDSVLAGVPGCGGGQLMRTRDGLIVVIVGTDEPVLMEAGRRFAVWAERNVPELRKSAQLEIWAGDLLRGTMEGVA